MTLLLDLYIEEKAKATWIQNNSKVVTWILNSIDTSIILSLQSYTKASDMWSHLKKIYHQTNKVRKYHIDTEIAKYNQGDKGVQEYYNVFLNLWHGKDSMVLETVSVALRPEAMTLQEESHISQFSMNLRPTFESIRATLMIRETSPNLDMCPGGSLGGTQASVSVSTCPCGRI